MAFLLVIWINRVYGTTIHVNLTGIIYTYVELILAILFYNHLTKGIFKTQYWVLGGILSVIYGVIYIYSWVYPVSITYDLVVESLLFIGLSLHYYWWMLNNLPEESIFKLVDFQLVSAILFLNAALFFIYLWSFYLVKVNQYDYIIGEIRSNIVILVLLVFTIILWKDLRRLKFTS